MLYQLVLLLHRILFLKLGIYYNCCIKLLLVESGDELEADANIATGRDGCLDNRKRIDDDVRNPPSGTTMRRVLPELPKTKADSNRPATTTEVASRTRQRRQDSGVGSNRPGDGGDGDIDRGSFIITCDAPPTRSEVRDSGRTTKTDWTAEMRLIAESKLQVRRRNDSQGEEPTEQIGVGTSRTRQAAKKATGAGLSPHSAKMEENRVVNGGRQLPTTSGRFVPIPTGVTTKPVVTKSGHPPVGPAAAIGRSKYTGVPNVGGSRSARTTPNQGPSPTKDIRQVRSRSSGRDETTTAAVMRSARPGAIEVVRRSGVSAGPTRRHPATDLPGTTSTRQSGTRNTTDTRQNVPPPTTKERSVSQKRPGEITITGRSHQQARTTPDATRSQQYSGSPERGRTSTRQAGMASRLTSGTQTSTSVTQSIYRSTSASVIPTPRRTESRSPQRPFATAPTAEQERLQNAREAFKKRMAYDPSKSAARGRAVAAARGSGNRGSAERLSSSSGDSRRSSGASDEDPFEVRVANYSHSVACDMHALAQRAGSGHALSTVDDDDNDSSTDTVRCQPACNYRK